MNSVSQTNSSLRIPSDPTDGQPEIAWSCQRSHLLHTAVFAATKSALEDRNVDIARTEENLSKVDDYILSATCVVLSHGGVCRRAAGYYSIVPSHRSFALLPAATILHPQPSPPSAPATYLLFL